MVAIRTGARAAVLLGGIWLACSASALRAGTVYPLTDSPESNGKLTLTPTAVHVEGTSASDVNLPDVLEADFTDAPFSLDYFSPKGDTLNHLPANWKAQDLEHVDLPGSFTYANGVLTLTGTGADPQRKEPEDKLYFIGQPWSGDGQWTIRVQQSEGETGLMLRDSLDPAAPMFAMGVNGGGGIFRYRGKAGDHQGWGGGFPTDIPVWVRLTRSGQSIDGAVSTDGKKWEIFGQNSTTVAASAWIGFYDTTSNEKVTAKAVLDQINFTPRLAQPENLIPGVLLRSGSFLAGVFAGLGPQTGSFLRKDKEIALTNDQVTADLLHQVTRRQISDVALQPGLILQNGDFLASDLNVIQGTFIQMNSVALGPVAYFSDLVRACVLHPLQTKASDYEIRLTDGSIIRASGIAVNNGQFVIQEVSGVTISAAAEEIAQVRAGLTKVQPLIDLHWKASAAPEETPLVQTWEGNNQEQILVAAAGATVDFPLTGKFRALAMRVALGPDAPPNTQATVRILADGKEVGTTPPFKAGDQPRFVQVTLPQPKTLTLVIDSVYAGTSVLFIDPVAVRAN